MFEVLANNIQLVLTVICAAGFLLFLILYKVRHKKNEENPDYQRELQRREEEYLNRKNRENEELQELGRSGYFNYDLDTNEYIDENESVNDER